MTGRPWFRLALLALALALAQSPACLPACLTNSQQRRSGLAAAAAKGAAGPLRHAFPFGCLDATKKEKTKTTNEKNEHAAKAASLP